MVADDLVQEALILALQRVGQLREPARLNARMYTILANCWRQHLRRARQRNDREIRQRALFRLS
jgi:RNA polymerase sigma-70 factor (ECF subfamily)